MGEHEKHRERMRSRFCREGLDAFAEHEVLELLLFYAIPRRNTNSEAHRLIDRFGSLDRVLAAPVEELTRVEGIGEKSAVLLNLVSQILQKINLPQKPEVLEGIEAAAVYLLDCYAVERSECVRLLCLDRKGRLLSCDRVREGSLSAADLDVRQIVRNAVMRNACSVILSHNHPGGLALPSDADYQATERIKNALDAVGIVLQDHIIVADRDYVSLRESGFL